MRSMSKMPRKIAHNPNQLNIFSWLESKVPSPGIDVSLRKAVSEGIRKSGKKRSIICAEIYELVDVEVPINSLNSWSAEGRAKSSDNEDESNNKRWGMPAELIPAFCHVTQYWEPLFILAESCNFKALKGKDVVRARLGLLKEEITTKTKELKILEKRLVCEN